MAERVGFEPTWSLWSPHPISSRRRYDHFGTSPENHLSNELPGGTGALIDAGVFSFSGIT